MPRDHVDVLLDLLTAEVRRSTRAQALRDASERMAQAGQMQASQDLARWAEETERYGR